MKSIVIGCDVRKNDMLFINDSGEAVTMSYIEAKKISDTFPYSTEDIKKLIEMGMPLDVIKRMCQDCFSLRKTDLLLFVQKKLKSGKGE